MKKIVFVVNSLSNGGAERVVTELATSMSYNHHVEIVTLYKELDYSFSDNIKIVVLSNKNRSQFKLKDRFLSYFKLKNYFANNSFDLITSHLLVPHVLMRLIDKHNKSFFVIHTVYSRKFVKYPKIRNIFLRWLYKNRNVVTVSHGVKSELDTFNIKYKTASVIHNPINKRDLLSKKNEPISIDTEFLLFTGRLNKLKRVDLLIKEYAKISDRFPRLVILGEGEEKKALINLAESLDISDKVFFVGWETNPYKWMARAELLVSCSEYEAFPMNIIESIACGTKVVAVDCDYGPREILCGDFSLMLLPENKLNSLSDKIIEVSKLNIPDLFQCVEGFQIEEITNQYLELEAKV